MYDDYGDRMKAYEKNHETFLNMSIPVVIRIDGKRFSKFTKKMVKPFDNRMVWCMNQTTYLLMEKLHADIGYVQSDEITLVFLPKKDANAVIIPFGGRVQKTVSVVAGMATALFIRNYDYILKDEITYGKSSEFYIEGANKFEEDVTPHFDCRIFNVPDAGEAANAVLWRIQDAKKNSISCAFRWSLGHKKMQNLSGVEMIAVMAENSIDFEKVFPESYRTGTIFYKNEIELLNDDLEKYTRKKIFAKSGEYFLNLPFKDKINFMYGE